MLELAMEYAGALSTIVFNESCRLWDLTEAQVGQNQCQDRIFLNFYFDQFHDLSLNIPLSVH